MSEHAHSEEEHRKHYIKVYCWLMIAFGVSLVFAVIGIQMEQPLLSIVPAFAVGFLKAYWVIKHFMHLNTEKPIIHMILIVCLAMMVLFVGATAADIMNHEGRNWTNDAAKAAVERGLAEMAEGGEHGEEAGEQH